MKLTHTLTDAQGLALIQLFPKVQVQGAQALSRAVDILLEQEQQRRGTPDPLTGAIAVAALLQGSLLQSEYDSGLHFDEDGWPVGGVVVDVKGMILHNARLGFARGGELLAAVARTLGEALPGTRVVRLHGDAFAALFLPTAGVPITEAHADQAREALTAALAPFGAPDAPVELTVAQLALRIVHPAHWQVLGPLVWSELERALLLEKLGRASGLQQRRVDLVASIPGPPTMTRE